MAWVCIYEEGKLSRQLCWVQSKALKVTRLREIYPRHRFCLILYAEKH